MTLNWNLIELKRIELIWFWIGLKWKRNEFDLILKLKWHELNWFDLNLNWIQLNWTWIDLIWNWVALKATLSSGTITSIEEDECWPTTFGKELLSFDPKLSSFCFCWTLGDKGLVFLLFDFNIHSITSRNAISFKEYHHGKKSLYATEAIKFCFFDVHINIKDAKRGLVFFDT